MIYVHRTSLFLSALGLSLQTAVAAPELTGYDPDSRVVMWDATAVTSPSFQVETAATPDQDWHPAAQVPSTGSVMTTFLNLTNPVSQVFRVTAWPTGGPATRHEMALIPGGTFAMGNPFENLAVVTTNTNTMVVTTNRLEGFDRESPVHDVPVSPFLIDRFEVTNEKFLEVMDWAYTNGLVGLQTSVVTNVVQIGPSTFLTNVVTNTTLHNLEGVTQVLYQVDHPWSEIRFATNRLYLVDSSRARFPIQSVSWYGALAYTAYRSDWEGLPRAVDMTVTNWGIDLEQSGYRLPTEAEWEKAARGGIAGTHFPWPDDSVQGTNLYLYSIDHVRGNIIDARFGAYLNQPRHPWHTNTLNEERLGSTPVGYYDGFQQIETAHTAIPSQSGADVWTTNDMANGYGLYDMGGNAWEWVWDWTGTNWYSDPAASLPDPIGQTNLALVLGPQDGNGGTIPTRVLRGGGWLDVTVRAPDPSWVRCSYREGQVPYNVFLRAAGFRTVRSIR